MKESFGAKEKEGGRSQLGDGPGYEPGRESGHEGWEGGPVLFKTGKGPAL